MTVTLRHGTPTTGTLTESVLSFPHAVEIMARLASEFSSKLGIPYAVDLQQPGFGTMAVGMADDDWMLMILFEDDRPSLTSLGNIDADGIATFWFGDWSEVSKKCLVPKDRALQAVKDWIEKAEVSKAIAWTDRIL